MYNEYIMHIIFYCNPPPPPSPLLKMAVYASRHLQRRKLALYIIFLLYCLYYLETGEKSFSGSKLLIEKCSMMIIP